MEIYKAPTPEHKALSSRNTHNVHRDKRCYQQLTKSNTQCRHQEFRHYYVQGVCAHTHACTHCTDLLGNPFFPLCVYLCI